MTYACAPLLTAPDVRFSAQSRLAKRCLFSTHNALYCALGSSHLDRFARRLYLAPLGISLLVIYRTSRYLRRWISLPSVAQLTRARLVGHQSMTTASGLFLATASTSEVCRPLVCHESSSALWAYTSACDKTYVSHYCAVPAAPMYCSFQVFAAGRDTILQSIRTYPILRITA
ncbi:hypothetical protein EXIGLDRAFT_215205 [Exidia glandulosa HHB12029]|uniref:Uncharacterized protein n=1 Tax=Exidia glandulosa HHB12029 TaxID=1314781 RepID=A0A165MU24_EXIGL|nr:hypothetical protein EXIGLDRAFT_215205 [Exidia glandulosa HHB12029]